VTGGAQQLLSLLSIGNPAFATIEPAASVGNAAGKSSAKSHGRLLGSSVTV
jgi:hypothetical protein